MTRCGTADLRISGWTPDGRRRSANQTTCDALNGTAAPGTKTMTTELGSGMCASARPRRLWASIAIALVAIASVVAGELWAFREGPALAITAKSEVATEVDSTLGRVVAASILIAPAD